MIVIERGVVVGQHYLEYLAHLYAVYNEDDVVCCINLYNQYGRPDKKNFEKLQPDVSVVAIHPLQLHINFNQTTSSTYSRNTNDDVKQLESSRLKHEKRRKNESNFLHAGSNPVLKSSSLLAKTNLGNSDHSHLNFLIDFLYSQLKFDASAASGKSNGIDALPDNNVLSAIRNAISNYINNNTNDSIKDTINNIILKNIITDKKSVNRVYVPAHLNNIKVSAHALGFMHPPSNLKFLPRARYDQSLEALVRSAILIGPDLITHICSSPPPKLRSGLNYVIIYEATERVVDGEVRAGLSLRQLLFCFSLIEQHSLQSAVTGTYNSLFRFTYSSNTEVFLVGSKSIYVHFIKKSFETFVNDSSITET
ncbi:hypothetical protein HELRODRAFT_175480 [Helobdella robusta]|uniref:Uncharacterized protein n=1 Tax=Helobdella robusta TaxID=6412 RepID=T1F9A8_HELRO|nr:hypothetical protein HELRODRAFT_175480 [Helobdella robusta]ESO00978.1 hypothetical protein HELRODRAFT_175480 [Helobdella robusta]